MTLPDAWGRLSNGYMEILTAAGALASKSRRQVASRPGVTLAQLGQHLAWLRWLAPLAMLGLVVLYEAGPARWLTIRWGGVVHLAGELVFYGTVGPVLALIAMELLRRWLSERETSELQAHLLDQAHGQDLAHAEDTEIAVQKVFAASLLLQSLTTEELPPQHVLGPQLATASRALDEALVQLSRRPSPPLNDDGRRVH